MTHYSLAADLALAVLPILAYGTMLYVWDLISAPVQLHAEQQARATEVLCAECRKELTNA